MKKILTILAVAFLAASVMTSCSKSEDPYPSYLQGFWSVYNASTGSSGYLSIQTILGGQHAYLQVFNAARSELVVNLEGVFTYDPETGIGKISIPGTVGSITATIQTNRGTDQEFSLSVSQMVSGGLRTAEFKCTAQKTQDFVTGEWNGTYTRVVGGTVYDVTLKITSLIHSEEGSCGTLTATPRTSAGSEKKALITAISDFVLTDTDDTYGIFNVVDMTAGSFESGHIFLKGDKNYQKITLWDEDFEDCVVLNKK